MNKDKDIEGIFSDQFEPGNIKSDGWNEPSDSVWDKIDERIGPESNGKRNYLSYMLLSLFLLSFIGGGYLLVLNKGLIKELKETKKELEVCGEVQEARVKSQIVDLGSANNIENSEQKIVKPQQVNTYTIEEAIASRNEIISPQKNNNVASIIPAKNENFIPIIVDNESTVEILSDLTANFSSLSSVRSDLNISQLKKKKLSRLLKFSRGVVIENRIIPIKEDEKINKIFSINAGLNTGFLSNTGFQESALSELIENEHGAAGFQITSAYEFAVSNKFSARVGAGISSQKFITEYDVTLPYSTSDEEIIDNEGFIDFQHSLPTSFGNTETELRLIRTRADDPLDESDVRLDFNTNHRLTNIILPLSINYNFNSLMDGFVLGLDVTPSVLIQTSSGIESVISRHSSISSVNNTSTSDYSDLRKMNVSIGAHMGYKYSISENSGLQFSAAYSQNLNSHFVTENYSSIIHGINVGLGYYISL